MPRSCVAVAGSTWKYPSPIFMGFGYVVEKLKIRDSDFFLLYCSPVYIEGLREFPLEEIR